MIGFCCKFGVPDCCRLFVSTRALKYDSLTVLFVDYALQLDNAVPVSLLLTIRLLTEAAFTQCISSDIIILCCYSILDLY